MTCESNLQTLADEQQAQVGCLLSIGCDLETAAGIVGCSRDDLQMALTADVKFARQVRHAEATAERKHMQNVYNAAKDEKHWRASVWWLERRSPERFARRPPHTMTPSQLESFLNILIEVLRDDVHDPGDQQRVVARLGQLAGNLEARLPTRERNQWEPAITTESLAGTGNVEPDDSFGSEWLE